MKIEDLKKLCLEGPSTHDLINTTGWITAMRAVMPRLVDVALSAKEFQKSMTGEWPADHYDKLCKSLTALEELTRDGRKQEGHSQPNAQRSDGDSDGSKSVRGVFGSEPDSLQRSRHHGST